LRAGAATLPRMSTFLERLRSDDVPIIADGGMGALVSAAVPRLRSPEEAVLRAPDAVVSLHVSFSREAFSSIDDAMAMRPVALDKAPYFTALVHSSLSDIVIGSTAPHSAQREVARLRRIPKVPPGGGGGSRRWAGHWCTSGIPQALRSELRDVV